jgi:glutaconyl-CoA/methylmalonyl-CoA decarboxylase subunit gamma
MKKLRITVEGKTYDVIVDVLEDDGVAPAASQPAAGIASALALTAPAAPAGGDEQIKSQLAGTIVSVEAAAGQTVGLGDPLLIIEAMKMNTTVTSPKAGTVGSIDVSAGDSVEEGQVLLTLSPA